MRKQKETSHHFHDIIKGCEMIEYKILTKNHKDKLGNVVQDFRYYQRCIIHNIILCRCGWEYGWHCGEHITMEKNKFIITKV